MGNNISTLRQWQPNELEHFGGPLVVGGVDREDMAAAKASAVEASDAAAVALLGEIEKEESLEGEEEQPLIKKKRKKKARTKKERKKRLQAKMETITTFSKENNDIWVHEISPFLGGTSQLAPLACTCHHMKDMIVQAKPIITIMKRQDDDIWMNIMSYVGIGNYLFVSLVCKDFMEIYQKYFTAHSKKVGKQNLPDVFDEFYPFRVVGRFYQYGMKRRGPPRKATAKDTFHSSAFSYGIKCAKFWDSTAFNNNKKNTASTTAAATTTTTGPKWWRQRIPDMFVLSVVRSCQEKKGKHNQDIINWADDFKNRGGENSIGLYGNKTTITTVPSPLRSLVPVTTEDVNQAINRKKNVITTATSWKDFLVSLECQPESIPPSMDPSLPVSLLISNSDIWVNNILPFVGPGHYIYLSLVCKKFKELYHKYWFSWYFSILLQDADWIKNSGDNKLLWIPFVRLPPKSRYDHHKYDDDPNYYDWKEKIQVALPYIASNEWDFPKDKFWFKYCNEDSHNNFKNDPYHIYYKSLNKRPARYTDTYYAAAFSSVACAKFWKDDTKSNPTNCLAKYAGWPQSYYSAPGSTLLPILHQGMVVPTIARHGNVDVFKWAKWELYPSGWSWCKNNVLLVAAMNGRLDILKYALKKQPSRLKLFLNGFYFEEVARKGYLDILKYVYHKVGFPGGRFPSSAIKLAKENGHNNVAKWLRSFKKNSTYDGQFVYVPRSCGET